MIGKIENVTMLSTASFAGKIRSEMLRKKIEGTAVEAKALQTDALTENLM